MVSYEVTVTIDPPLGEAYERYMRQQHIPDVLATGCFQAAVLTRSSAGSYRTRYDAPSQADLDRYLAIHAGRLREHFAARFPQGVTVSREVWTVIEEWDAPPPEAA